MTSMVNIGANKETVAETYRAIIGILEAEVDQSTMVVALETLRGVCSVNNVNVSNCQFKSEDTYERVD